MKKLISAVWRNLPRIVRRRIVKLTQNRFTVSAAAVILNGKKEVLLLEHLLRPGSGWGLPGGFLDKGESPEQAIKRELLEETGIELSSLRLVRMHTAASHIESIFTAEYEGPVEIKSYGIIGLGWFAADALPEGFDYGQRLIINKVLSGEI